MRVSVTPPAATVDLIDQRVLFVEQTDKRALLSELLQAAAAGRVLVFTRTKRRADHVAQQLSRSGIRADAIHSDKSQSTRERLLHGFRTGKMRVLVATDLASRGIDVDGITHVINYDLPHEPESYVHRIGRTGRAGAAGTALSFCDVNERGCLQAIEKLIRRRLDVQADHPYHSAWRRRPPRHGDPRPAGPASGLAPAATGGLGDRFDFRQEPSSATAGRGARKGEPCPRNRESDDDDTSCRRTRAGSRRTRGCGRTGAGDVHDEPQGP